MKMSAQQVTAKYRAAGFPVDDRAAFAAAVGRSISTVNKVLDHDGQSPDAFDMWSANGNLPPGKKEKPQLFARKQPSPTFRRGRGYSPPNGDTPPAQAADPDSDWNEDEGFDDSDPDPNPVQARNFGTVQYEPLMSAKECERQLVEAVHAAGHEWISDAVAAEMFGLGSSSALHRMIGSEVKEGRGGQQSTVDRYIRNISKPWNQKERLKRGRPRGSRTQQSVKTGIRSTAVSSDGASLVSPKDAWMELYDAGLPPNTRGSKLASLLGYSTAKPVNIKLGTSERAGIGVRRKLLDTWKHTLFGADAVKAKHTPTPVSDSSDSTKSARFEDSMKLRMIRENAKRIVMEVNELLGDDE